MKLIVGLGNPGNKYEKTRHNVGFMIAFELVGELISEAPAHPKLTPEQKFGGELYSVPHKGQEVYVFRPNTFMNESGTAVQRIVNFYKIDLAKDLLVVHDDVDLPLGVIRKTSRSSSAGHKGVQDIINRLGTNEFQRIRVGIDSRASRTEKPTENFVLENFPASELNILEEEVFPMVITEIKKFLDEKK
ncbi:MAG: aminoacyl-tRNA hydrolase [Candidatus Doudnabacteria bacterium RIFCSPHIGHO2_01_52_17]|uniref:Peptidyl-tRNA hydrolase n=1 Tax=Candidatus Doudnabacteria bacterium RIFCSPHIGHO2_01_52_17 TaxID=1817820 RepID=A0A1F5NEX8_9BACT|nr:MAG: aminoacyl-tRNA hydrolase [Candidatus Doudnabacteria bacterium RIFCSPHIGHO2_01_52_17]